MNNTKRIMLGSVFIVAMAWSFMVASQASVINSPWKLNSHSFSDK